MFLFRSVLASTWASKMDRFGTKIRSKSIFGASLGAFLVVFGVFCVLVVRVSADLERFEHRKLQKTSNLNPPQCASRLHGVSTEYF